MSAGHDHSAGVTNERQLLFALGLTGSLMIAEIIGGVVTGSLALLSDAAHMFTDTAALVIALVAIRIAQRAADHKRTFGYYRFEILAATFNASLLFIVALFILYEAYRRFINPTDVATGGMLVIATLGLVVNLVSMRILHAGSTKSLNVKGAYLEVWSDMLGSLGVIVAALVIRLTGWLWIDPIIAAGIGLWVLPRTWVLLRESLNVLLEGVPEGLVLQDIEKGLAATAGVVSVHDLHVWSLSSGKNSLSAHVVIDTSQTDVQQALGAMIATLTERFGITHSTLQVELQACAPDDQCSLTASAHPHEHDHDQAVDNHKH